MKKKILLILVIFISIFFINIQNGKCDYSLTDSNSNDDIRGDSGGSGAAGGSRDGYWHDQESLKITVYRNGNVIAGPTYFVIKNQPSTSFSPKGYVNCTCGNQYNFSSVKYNVLPSGCSCSTSNSITYNSSYTGRFGNKTFWGMYYSSANTLKNILVDGSDYPLIREIIDSMKPDSIIYQNDDYVIVEPVVRVRCNGYFYTGTINSLIENNVSYFNSNSNPNRIVCGGTYGTSFAVYVYSAIGQSFKAENKRCYGSSTKGHGIYQIGYDFNNYDSCGYNKFILGTDFVITTPCTIVNGKYYDDKGNETTEQNYKKACGCKIRDGKYYNSDAKLVATEAEYNKSCLTCAQRVNNSNPITRISIYNEYKEDNTVYNNILDFSKTGKDACTNDENDNFKASCLSASLASNTSFSEKNLSSYNFKISMPTSDKVAYCLASFSLTPTISTPNFGNNFKAGMAFIGGTNTQSTIANGMLSLTCYLYNPLNGDENVNVFQNLTYDSFISNIKFNGQNLVFTPIDSESSTTHSKGTYNSVNYIKYEKTIRRTYIIPEANVEIGSGVVLDSKTDYTRTIYGYFSKLNDSGTVYIDFSVNLNRSTLLNKTLNYTNNKACYYTVNDGIIKNNEARFKFRTIDTNNPFIGKNDRDKNGNGRTVGANWCYKNVDGTYDCSSDNKLVQSVIKNTNNSYNKLKQNPKYKFVLNPTAINKIREYNKSHKLDEYELICEGSNCKSNFFNVISEYITFGKDILVP